MGLSLRPEHLKRYKAIARLLMKYGRSDLVRELGVDVDLRIEEPTPGVTPEARELAADLEKMGAAYVKLGQLLSTRTDIIPAAYAEALVQLQDEVTPFPYEQAAEIVSSELGVRLNKAFQSFDETPLAAASLGQVHHAVLRSGQEVAVKVQRPGVRAQVAEDLDVLEEIASFLDKHTDFGRRYGVLSLVAEARRTLVRELDYRQEAGNLRELGKNLAEFERIIVVQPIDDYSTSRVLTMEYIHGKKITDMSPLRRTELDVAGLAEEIFRAYLKQILVDGFVHIDPHPGNVFLTDTGHAALLDLGMVAHVPPQLQSDLVKLLIAIAEGRGEDAADIAIKIGQKTEHFNHTKMRHEITQLVVDNRDSTIETMEAGRLVLRIGQIAGQSGILVPPQITMIGKALLNLDQIGRTLYPQFQPNESIRRNAGAILRKRMRKHITMRGIYNTVLETNEFVQMLPSRLNSIMDVIARNELKLHVDALDEDRLIQGIQKIANRITLGIILAALIVGAALIMRVETEFKVWGYPGLAMILFFAAVLGGGMLAYNIVFHDEHRNSRHRQ